MIVFLRWLGVVNAAVWFGSGVFFTVAVAPAFFSSEMKQLLSLPYAGAAAQIVLKRYYFLQLGCGLIAILHLLSEWLYTGKRVQRFVLLVLTVVLSLGLLGGLWLQPKLKDLYRTKYSPVSTPEQKQAAGRSFGLWHGAAQMLNVAAVLGLLIYLSQMTAPNGGTRFVPFHKFRG